MDEFLDCLCDGTDCTICNMPESLIKDWLSEWASLDPGQVHSYAAVLDNNQDLIQTLHMVFEQRIKHETLLDPVCDQLFSFYRSREPPLIRFTLQFLPTLTYIYLASVAAGDKKSCKSVETLLLGMYNLEVVTDTGEPVLLSFRMPSLAQGSLYHEPTREAFTEAALRRYEEVNTKPVTWGPYPQTEVLNAQNRLRVLTALLFVFNRHIGTLHSSALKYLCKASSRIVTQGYSNRKHQNSSSNHGISRLPQRIPVSSPFLLELASGLYYAMYNDFGHMAMQAIEDMYQRSCFECFSEVILVANAIKNSSHVSSTGEPAEGPMGISVALSSVTTTVTTVNKSMITNASFRTKKLPDDIPIISGEEVAANGDLNALSSITEEKEEEPSSFTPRGASLRGKDAVTKNLQKLGIGKKQKSKNNPSEKTPSSDKKSKKSLIHNGEMGDSVDSPQCSAKRKNTIESIENGMERSGPDNNTSDVLEILPMEDELRRLDVSPTAHKKLLDHEDKPMMQITLV